MTSAYMDMLRLYGHVRVGSVVLTIFLVIVCFYVFSKSVSLFVYVVYVMKRKVLSDVLITMLDT